MQRWLAGELESLAVTGSSNRDFPDSLRQLFL